VVVKVENGKIVEGDLEVIREGGSFQAIINGHKGRFECGPNYTNVRYTKDEEIIPLTLVKDAHENDRREQEVVGNPN
jgi:hypothetical protein